MSTVSEYVECPKCKGVAHSEFNCRTFEESCFCLRCGHCWGIRNLRDRKKEGDGAYFKLTKAGRLIQREYALGPHGILVVNGECGGTLTPLSREPGPRLMAKLKAAIAAGEVKDTSYLTNGQGLALVGPGCGLFVDEIGAYECTSLEGSDEASVPVGDCGEDGDLPF